MEDVEIIQQIQEGNQEALDCLVKKYYADVYRYAYFLMAHKELAEDITQETFLLFIQKLPRYHHMGKCRSYLFRITHNLYVDYYRKKSNTMQDAYVESMENYALETEDKTSNLAMVYYLKQISSREREILLLHYYYEFTYHQIAVILSLGVSNVKYHARKGLKTLHELMEKERNL